ncbi:hypothetical protein HDU91_003731, partial [Kappamyces sp. JEL0680]
MPSIQFVESQWLYSSSCSLHEPLLAPNSIFVFTDDPLADSQMGYWPVMYANHQYYVDWAYPACGYAMHATGGFLESYECCTVNVAGLDTSGYGSGMIDAIRSKELATNILSNVPISANGHTYCMASRDGESALMGYDNLESVLILADGECVEGSFQCFPNGTFAIYQQGSSANCTGDSEVLQLTALGDQLGSSFFGPATTNQLVAIEHGSKHAAWIEYLPSAEIAVLSKTPLEVVQLLFIACSIFSMFVALLINLKRFARIRKRGTLL